MGLTLNPITGKFDVVIPQTPWKQNINADGFTLFGNDGGGENLILGSTSHATKGKILFGTSAYDEVNNRLGIGTDSPSVPLEVIGNVNLSGDIYSTDSSSGLTINGYNQTSGDTAGTGVHLYGGSGFGAGAGGGVGFSGGLGGATGNGGSVSFTAGGGGATSGGGGNVDFAAGDASTSGNGGDVIFWTGLGAGAGNPGRYIFNDPTQNYGSILDFSNVTSDGLTYSLPNNSGTFALATGLAGGQTIYGGTATSNNLTLVSTSNATKGKTTIGGTDLVVDEVNHRVGIGTVSPATTLDVSGKTTLTYDGADALVVNYYDGPGRNLNGFVVKDTSNQQANFAVQGSTSSSAYRVLVSSLTEGSGYFQVYSSGLNAYNDMYFLGKSINFETTTSTYAARKNALHINSAAKVGIGTTSPTAVLHLKAGTASANTAPLKFTSGTLNTTAEAGSMEFLTDDFYATITTGAARKGIVLNDGTNLTSGRVPFATTNGRLTDDADMTFATDTLTVANVAIGTAISGPKFKITSEGGYAIKLTNKTGTNSVKGTVVYVSTGTDNAFNTNPIDGDMPFGVVYDDGVADASECWVVVSGIAEVLLVDSVATTRSYIAYSSGTTAGRIDTSATVPAALNHFREVGHTLESKEAGTSVLVKCVLHFN